MGLAGSQGPPGYGCSAPALGEVRWGAVARQTRPEPRSRFAVTPVHRQNCVPTNLLGGSPDPKVTTFGDGAFREVNEVK